MHKQRHQQEIDFVIVGSGPGGATLARALARAGQRVALLERGRDWRGHPLYGTYPGAMLYTKYASFFYTREGINIIRPLMLGGATSMYCACAERPLPWWQEKYGIDLDAYAEETVRELNIAPLPAELRGTAATRIAEAGTALGQTWTPQDKFYSLQGVDFDCGAKCMLGCRCGAKWNAAAYVDEAAAAGCHVWTEAKVERVLIANGKAVGVQGTRKGQPFTLSARHVIVSAGGVGTAELLRRSGLQQAGQGMTLDTTVMVYGHAPYKGIGEEPPMTWKCADDELGVLYSTLIDPWLMYPIITLLKGPAYPLSWYRWGHTLGVMIKLKDEVSGGLDERGRWRKGVTDSDKRRLQQAEQVARHILLKAGCNPDTLFTTPARGTHPSGTVRIGHTLTKDLETEIENLYVCDASVFPEALARPTVLTIISLAKRLAARLLEKEKVAGKQTVKF